MQIITITGAIKFDFSVNGSVTLYRIALTDTKRMKKALSGGEMHLQLMLGAFAVGVQDA